LWIAGQEYDLEYGYDLAGQLVSERYPSGRVVTNTYDANGRLAGVADGSRTYLSNLQFQGLGGSLSSMSYGNGISQSVQLNSRGQVTQMAWVKDGTVVNRYDYKFGQIDPSTNTVNTAKNNGQLAQVDSYIGGSTSSPTKQYTQKYIYDAVGRLERETEYRGDNGNQVYSQKFSYDRFGNRYLRSSENSAANDPLFPFFIEDNNVDRATNRLASNTNTSYDESGDVVTDNKFRGLKYFYDANGRMVKSSTLSDVEVGIAVMDAAGNKVGERVNDVWRFAVYDAFGRLVADYGGPAATDEGGVKFVQQDIQGSTRCVTSISGSVIARMDYQAFGEQIPSNIGQRTAIGFTNTNSIRHRYALTENDTATGLNDTWWRKLENRAGRWTSPDPYSGSASVSDPQSFNRNSYVQNDPINFVDPSGLNMVMIGNTIYDCQTDITSNDGEWGVPVTTCRVVMTIGGGGGPTSTGMPGGEEIGGEGGGGGGHVISDCAQKLLQGFFPKLDLSKVRLRLGLPAIAPTNTTSGDKIGGLTFGNTIYTDSQQDFESHYGATWGALEFLAHELTHVDQFRRLTKTGFIFGYALEGLFQGLIRPAGEAISATYRKNAFETRAQTNAARIIRELKRKGASPCPIEAGILATVNVS